MPKINAAAPNAGAVKETAQPALTAPTAAPSSGCTAAIARPAGTAKATSRRSLLALGTFKRSRRRQRGHRGRPREDALRRHPPSFDVPVHVRTPELGNEFAVEDGTSRAWRLA